MTVVEERIQERIRELRHRYALTLPDRVATISRLVMEVGARKVQRAELLRQLHTLAGTAGTFGYDDIAALAGEAECFLSRSSSLPEVTPAEVRHVAWQLAGLDQAVSGGVQ